MIWFFFNLVSTIINPQKSSTLRHYHRVRSKQTVHERNARTRDSQRSGVSQWVRNYQPVFVFSFHSGWGIYSIKNVPQLPPSPTPQTTNKLAPWGLVNASSPSYSRGWRIVHGVCKSLTTAIRKRLIPVKYCSKDGSCHRSSSQSHQILWYLRRTV